MSNLLKTNPNYLLGAMFIFIGLSLIVFSNDITLNILFFEIVIFSYLIIFFNKIFLKKLNSSINLFFIDYYQESIKLIKNYMNMFFLIISAVLLYQINSFNEDIKSIAILCLTLMGVYYNLFFLAIEKILLDLKFTLSELIEINKLDKFISINDLFQKLNYSEKNILVKPSYFNLDKKIISILNYNTKIINFKI